MSDYGIRTKLRYDKLPLDHPEREILACIKIGSGVPSQNHETKTDPIHCDIAKILKRQMKFIIEEA